MSAEGQRPRLLAQVEDEYQALRERRAARASAASLVSLAEARANTDTPRRITGSRERASFSGNGFPITNNASEGKIRLDAESWQLAVAGAVDAPFTLTYDELLALPA